MPENLAVRIAPTRQGCRSPLTKPDPVASPFPGKEQIRPRRQGSRLSDFGLLGVDKNTKVRAGKDNIRLNSSFRNCFPVR